MNFGRWMLALLGTLAVMAMAAVPAGATPRPFDEPVPAGPSDDGADQPPADDPAEDEDPADDEAQTREAVPGQVPARIRERLVTARRALRDAGAAADAGNDRRAGAHLKRVQRNLDAAQDAAIERADDELPGGAAAVRAVTAVEHQAIGAVTDIALDADGRLYARAIATVEASAEDRDDAARFLVETGGTDDAVTAVGTEVEQELGDLGAVLDDEGTDEDLADDISGVVDTVTDTAQALGLDLPQDDAGDDVSDDDVSDDDTSDD